MAGWNGKIDQHGSVHVHKVHPFWRAFWVLMLIVAIFEPVKGAFTEYPLYSSLVVVGLIGFAVVILRRVSGAQYASATRAFREEVTT
jgi:hypothetical protein